MDDYFKMFLVLSHRKFRKLPASYNFMFCSFFFSFLESCGEATGRENCPAQLYLNKSTKCHLDTYSVVQKHTIKKKKPVAQGAAKTQTLLLRYSLKGWSVRGGSSSDGDLWAESSRLNRRVSLGMKELIQRLVIWLSWGERHVCHTGKLAAK